MSPEGVGAYAQVNATTRALYSKLLSQATWERLIQAQNFEVVLSVLSKTEAYAPHLDIDRTLLTPRRTVYQIKNHLSRTYEKLIRISPEPGRQLLIQLWRLYEVDNLKATLRGIETGASWNQVLFVLSPMARPSVLSTALLEEMVRSGDVERAIRLTEGTPYYDTLSHAMERYREEQSLFPLEVALDLDYYRALWQIVNELTGLDHEWAVQLIGSVIDINNLMWAARYRIFHHLSQEEIINYTLPFGYQVTDEDIRTVASGGDVMAVIARIYPEIREAMAHPQAPEAGLRALEQALEQILIQRCHEAMRRGAPFHIGVQVAYLMLTEFEIRDLTVLIEAKATNMPAEFFEPLLEIQHPDIMG